MSMMEVAKPAKKVAFPQSPGPGPQTSPFPVKLLKTKRPFTPRETQRYLSKSSLPLVPIFDERRTRKGSSEGQSTRLPEIEKRPASSEFGRRRQFRSQHDSSDSLFLASSLGNGKSESASAPVVLTTSKTAKHHVISTESPLSASAAVTSAVSVPMGAAAEKIPLPPEPVKVTREIELELCLDNLRRASADLRTKTLEDLETLKRLVTSSMKVDSHTKRSIFAVISPLVQSEDNDILIAVLDVILHLRVSKGNFALASKLFFHVASSDKNDKTLMSRGIIDQYMYLLGKACPKEDVDAIVFGYGALKFLSFNEARHLCQKGLVDLMVLHLKILVSSLEESVANPLTEDKAATNKRRMEANGVFQITACLRNAINDREGLAALVGLDGQRLLTSVTKSYSDDTEVVCNLARIYSILSVLDAKGNMSLEHDDETLDQILNMVKLHSERNEILVRLAFCLGNFAATNEDARREIAEHGADFLAVLLKRYVDTALVKGDGKSNEAFEALNKVDLGSAGTKADTIVKLIRIFANVSIHAESGEAIALNPVVVQCLVSLVKETPSADGLMKEVLLPALSTLNNLSFYPILLHNEIYEVVLPLIEDAEEDAVKLESVRVLGNLSRRKDIRTRLMRDEVKLRAILDMTSPDSGREIQFTATGIIVNMMTDYDFRMTFADLGGLECFSALLEESGKGEPDWPLASLVCQAIWNFSIDSANANEVMAPNEIERLEKILVTLLDNDDGDDSESEASASYHEFAGVGFHLLSKLCNDQLLEN